MNLFNITDQSTHHSFLNLVFVGWGYLYATRMNLYNLNFQMVDFLYKLKYTNWYIGAAGCTLKVGAAGCTLMVRAAGNTNCTP